MIPDSENEEVVRDEEEKRNKESIKETCSKTSRTADPGATQVDRVRAAIVPVSFPTAEVQE